jgi:triacylglycerol lipase
MVVVSLLAGSIRPAAAATPARQNSYPIVLVHGFAGWGRDEVLGFKHWGGFYDIQADLISHGFSTYTAAVGPFSSNWDRAIELYAQIAGGRVDYGAAHSAKHGHARYGRTYAGFYPQWGKLDPGTGKINKIHLVSHSQGGQTVRVLAQLLAEGSPAEVAATPASGLSPLFSPLHRSWIDSITTISSPHDGTTLATGVTELIPAAQQLIAMVAAVAGSNNINLYDFKLDQWGLTRLPNESFSSYADRVWNSSLWRTSKDICAWDLSPDGAKELNSWVKAQPDIYYFSWATEKTYDSLLTPYQYPELTINPILVPEAFFMGSYTRNQTGLVPINKSWWKNDGVVNTNSMDGPTLSSTDQIVTYNGTPLKGAWNYMGVLESYDHLDIIGLGIYYDVRGWYQNLAARLGALPE